MKYVLTIMMRRMVKLNLIEIKIQDLQFSLHFFLFFCCAGRLHRNLIEIKKKIYGHVFGCSWKYVLSLYSEIEYCLD